MISTIESYPNFKNEKCLVDWEDMLCYSPKMRLCIEFYPSFIAIISQQIAKNENTPILSQNRTIIPYSEFQMIIQLPGVYFIFPKESKTCLRSHVWLKQHKTNKKKKKVVMVYHTVTYNLKKHFNYSFDKIILA